MGMSVSPFVIKCKHPVVWEMGAPKPNHTPILLPSDFMISVVDDDLVIPLNAVPLICLTRQRELFEFLSNIIGDGGLAMPGYRRRIKNTEKFIDFLCTEAPTYIDNESASSVIEETSTNFRDRYLLSKYTSVLYSLDFLANYDYDAKLTSEDVDEVYRGRSLREIFDDVTRRNYFGIINEAHKLGWDAILFNFH